ncbi:hypothetical protein [Dinghuibacter silviterrae]|nr:hypothetical protein [Dinghuibacter silviterrae]
MIPAHSHTSPTQTASRAAANTPASNGGPLPIQAKFAKLSEERIIAVRNKAKEDGEDLDTEYLQGLYIKGEDAANNKPQLFFKVASVPKNYFTGLGGDAAKNIFLFAHVESVEQGEAKEALLKTTASPKNLLQILQEDLLLWDENETGPKKVDELANNAERFVPGQKEKTKNDLVGSVLLGGVAEDDGGGYGSIEFRFKVTTGDLFILSGVDGQKEALEAKYPQVRVLPEGKDDLKKAGLAYTLAKLPYAKERVSDTYVYVEESLIEAHTMALIELLADLGVDERTTGGSLSNASAGAALPARPIAAPKVREKKYVYRATRGSRDAGQKAAMSNFSAKDYVKRFSADEANATDWEWLHIQGSRLGGPNRPENLVAGTADANTHMIPYERAIFELSSVATQAKPVNVKWSASVRKDADGNNTHVGNEISIDVAFPNGAPTATDNVKPTEAIKIFPSTFKASDSAPFTKKDRDLLDAVKKGE